MTKGIILLMVIIWTSGYKSMAMDDNGFLKGVAAMDTIRDTTTPEGFKDAWDKLEGDGWRIVDVRKIDGGKLIELTGVRRRPSKKHAWDTVILTKMVDQQQQQKSLSKSDNHYGSIFQSGTESEPSRPAGWRKEMVCNAEKRRAYG